MKSLLLLAIGVGCALGLPKFMLGRPEGGFILKPDNLEELNAQAAPLVTHGYYTQLLDHFNPLDGRTYQQYYITNNNYYKPGGPIFVQIGGEGAIDDYFSERGDWVENGKKYQALMFQLEHRYYGKSLPFSDLATPNMVYLTVEQALEDTAQFILAMKAQYGIPNAKVIVFGGSYSGACAAWFRLKYPHVADGAVGSSGPVFAKADFFGESVFRHVADGAVGSSGPVFAKADFFEYLEVTGASAETIVPGCYNNIKTAFSNLATLISASNATNTLGSLFKYRVSGSDWGLGGDNRPGLLQQHQDGLQQPRHPHLRKQRHQHTGQPLQVQSIWK